MNKSGSTEVRDDLVDQEGENVETFLMHGSLKPVILQPSPTISNGKRRWRLLRNVARATRRRSSLTVPEEKLLQAISEPRTNLISPSNSARRNELRASRRSSLRDSITSKRSSLTDAESSFFDKLLDSDDVSLEGLQKCFQVLSKDPLYQTSSDNSLTDTEVSFKQERPKLEERDASFRKETWKHYIATSWKSNQELSTPDQDEPEKQIEEPAKPIGSTSWMSNIFSNTVNDEKEEEPQGNDEDLPPPCILATSADDSVCNPHVMSPPIMDALRPYLPYAIQEDNYWLKYSMIRDGASMRALLQNVRSSAKTIIAIETMEGDVFGSFTSSPWRPHGRGYYGTCEAFMWRLKKSRFTPCGTVEEQIRLESEVEVFPWAGLNRNVQALVNPDSQLVLGGGGEDDDPFAECEEAGSALILEPCLTRGTSAKCLTFKSPTLPVTEQDTFQVANVEVWTMTPVENLDQAIKLELGRQFVFDHGNFSQE